MTISTYYLYLLKNQGCSEPGDYVDDTPAEAIPAVGCPIGRNTCPNRPGIDPVRTYYIHFIQNIAFAPDANPQFHLENFMDSSYDSCMNNFTPGQADRIKDQISIYRGL